MKLTDVKLDAETRVELEKLAADVSLYYQEFLCFAQITTSDRPTHYGVLLEANYALAQKTRFVFTIAGPHIIAEYRVDVRFRTRDGIEWYARNCMLTETPGHPREHVSAYAHSKTPPKVYAGIALAGVEIKRNRRAVME